MECSFSVLWQFRRVFKVNYSNIQNVFSVVQLNELVVGDTSGKLLVYKNDDSKPWITRSCVGMVSESFSFSFSIPHGTF